MTKTRTLGRRRKRDIADGSGDVASQQDGCVILASVWVRLFGGVGCRVQEMEWVTLHRYQGGGEDVLDLAP